MFNTEFDDNLIDLIKDFPVVFSRQGFLPEMEASISRAFSAIAGKEPDFSEFGSLLRTSSHKKDIALRKTAWLAQRVAGVRAVSVGQRILKGSASGWKSPLAGQLNQMGLLSNPAWPEQLHSLDTSLLTKNSQTLDAMLVDLGASTVYAVVGVPGSQLRKLSKDLRTGGLQQSLFVSANQALINAVAPGATLRRAARAAELIRMFAPDLQVVPLCILFDDEEGSWTYQIHQIPHASSDIAIQGDQVFMDALPLQDSILSHLAVTGDARPDLSIQGIGPSPKFLERLPVDRASRPLMFLDRLFEAQVACPQRLHLVNGSVLHHDVQQHFIVHLDRDMRRHDLEDCLINGGWVRRSMTKTSEYYVTAAGVGLLMLARQRFAPSTSHLGPTAIGLMQRQAKFEFEYRAAMSR